MKYVVVVNGFISGNAIAWELVSRGYRCIHVYSSMEHFKDHFRENVSLLYDRNLIYTSHQKFTTDVWGLDIIAVVAGTDSGSELADIISYDLELVAGNKPAPLRYLRDLLYVANGGSAARENFQKFVDDHPEHERFVVKPLISEGGCDRVQFFNRDVDFVDQPGMFIAPFHPGVEYAIDTVSAKGQHKVCAVWRYTPHQGTDHWRHRIDLVDPVAESELVRRLHAYVSNVLNLSRQLWGAAHTEVKVDGDNIHLMEVNFRNNGHMDLGTTKVAFEGSQVERVASVMTGDLSVMTDLSSYKIKEYVLKIFFMNKKERHYSEFAWHKIASMPSVSHVFQHYRFFETIPVSEMNYRSIPAIIVMKNKDQEQLDADEKQLRKLLDEY